MASMTVQHNLKTSLETKGYFVGENFLPEPLARELFSEATNLATDFQQATIGQRKQASPHQRGDRIFWIDESTSSKAQRTLFDLLGSLKYLLNESLFLNIDSMELHFAVYPPGGFYERHRDAFKHRPTDRARVVSFIFYLNPNWSESDGGALKLYLNDSILTVLPKLGTAVFFLSQEIEHEVLPTHKDRWSIAGWMRRR